MKLLVTGAAGYLGTEVCRQAVERGWDVLAAQFVTPPAYGRPVRLDVRNEAACARICLRHRPDAVVHTAYRQSGADLGSTVVEGSCAVALNAHRYGARLVHLSTDLVFDGEAGAPYREDAECRPVSPYGRAKAHAEREVPRLHPEALLVRTSLLYGKPVPGPQEFLAARQGEFYVDEIRCPTHVGDLAAALLELVELDRSGLLHVAAPEALSRHAFARLLRGAAGGDPDAVRAATSPRVGRARNVALDSTVARGLLRTSLRPASDVLGGA